ATQAKRGPRFQRDALPLLAAPLTLPVGCADAAYSRESAMAAIESHANASGSQTPVEPGAGDVANPPSNPPPDPQHVNGRIPVNPLLPHLDNPAAPNGNGGTTDWQTALHHYHHALSKWRQ